MIAATHPLFGCLLEATSFKRVSGRLFLVVGLPDGAPGTIAAEATSVFGDTQLVEAGSSVLSVEGIRRLRMLVEAMPSGQRRTAGTRK